MCWTLDVVHIHFILLMQRGAIENPNNGKWSWWKSILDVPIRKNDLVDLIIIPSEGEKKTNKKWVIFYVCEFVRVPCVCFRLNCFENDKPPFDNGSNRKVCT